MEMVGGIQDVTGLATITPILSMGRHYHLVVAESPDPATRPTEGLPPPPGPWRPSVGAVARSGDRATTGGRPGHKRRLIAGALPFHVSRQQSKLSPGTLRGETMPDVPPDESEDARPWEAPGEVRRDCLPHRGHVLMWIGAASVVCGVTAPVLGVTAFAGFVLGLAAYWLAVHDLRAMAGGCMDSRGREETERARHRAEVGIGLSVVSLAVCGFLGAALGPMIGFYLAG
jgi:hypothetical protein